MFFIRQRHTYSRLSIRRELFEVLMSRFGVFPKFRDFVLLFGSKQEESELAPPSLRFRARNMTDIAINEGRNVNFECAYGLRYVELNHRSTARPWSMRQMAVYQGHKSMEKSSIWILLSASQRTETCIDRYIKSAENLHELNPFEIHVLILEIALTNWRPYIMHLTKEISQQTDLFSVASIDEEHPIRSINFEARQNLNDLEDELIDTLLILDSTEETVESLRENYERLCSTLGSQSEGHEQDANDSICRALQEKKQEIVTDRKKIHALRTKLKGTIKLLSSLLDLDNGISLKRLTQEATEESGSMRRLAERSTQDAATVKMLTVITIVYLPATAISVRFTKKCMKSLAATDCCTEFLFN